MLQLLAEVGYEGPIKNHRVIGGRCENSVKKTVGGISSRAIHSSKRPNYSTLYAAGEKKNLPWY